MFWVIMVRVCLDASHCMTGPSPITDHFLSLQDCQTGIEMMYGSPEEGFAKLDKNGLLVLRKEDGSGMVIGCIKATLKRVK
jgi:hypothetical protein